MAITSRIVRQRNAGSDESGAETEDASAAADERVVEEYVFDIRIVETATAGDDRFRVEIPGHREMTFDGRATAELYVDVYFDVNGFEERGTGDRGVPPEIIQAGKDTVAAYLLTQPGVDVNWMASFYGVKQHKIDRYVSWVRERAEEIRAGAADLDAA